MRSLHFTLWATFIIWNLFPLAWLIARMGPRLAHLGEPLNLISNFCAKVFFSSCILYNNFVTLQQRRIAAQLEQEHKERIVMVQDLKVALGHKDQFISVVGHELRTPLNAIIQLSSAMTRTIGEREREGGRDALRGTEDCSTGKQAGEEEEEDAWYSVSMRLRTAHACLQAAFASSSSSSQPGIMSLLHQA